MLKKQLPKSAAVLILADKELAVEGIEVMVGNRLSMEENRSEVVDKIPLVEDNR